MSIIRIFMKMSEINIIKANYYSQTKHELKFIQQLQNE